MISGIMPCSGWLKTDYPWKQALRCWARVCDEIVIVTYRYSEVGALFQAAEEIHRKSTEEDHRCEVNVRAIYDPPLIGFGGYASYLMYGLFLAQEPDWMLAVEADYLISPLEAKRLRDFLLNASPQSEVVMARVLTLNYDGTSKLYNPDFKNNFPPYDGYVWDRPIGCRPKLGVFPAPFNGVDRQNVQITCEAFVRLRKGAWGHSFNSKFLNHNPMGFDIVRTDVTIEHLSFTRSGSSLISKLKHPYFVDCSLTVDRVLAGDEPYFVSYPELQEIPGKYIQYISFLRSQSGV